MQHLQTPPPKRGRLFMKAVGTKDIKKGAKKGLKPKQRALATTAPKHTIKRKLTANQWQNSPKHTKFMELWLNPDSQLFGNAHKSALEAGFSTHYANQIASPSVNNKWITEYTKKLTLTDEHIRQGIQTIAIRANNSKSPDDTRLKAYETLARIGGMLDTNRGNVTVNVVQPILGGQSVKPSERTVIDVE